MTAPVVHHGDCIEVMRGMADNSVDAIVTDPPYSLAFMGRTWDRHDTPQDFQQWCQEWATEAMRVLKPGGHMLAAGSSRTFHRLVTGVEDAGLEIRDTITWHFGSGFPKSLNVSAALDRIVPPDARCVCGPRSIETIPSSQAGCPEYRDSGDAQPRSVTGSGLASPPSLGDARARTHAGHSAGDLAAVPTSTAADAAFGHPSIAGSPTHERHPVVVAPPVSSAQSDTQTNTSDVPVSAPRKTESHIQHTSGLAAGSASLQSSRNQYMACKQCGLAKVPQGMGTALKPATEFFTVARKPLAKGLTVAANVIAHGTGALNIDGCRIGSSDMPKVTTAPGWAWQDAENAKAGFRPNSCTTEPVTYTPNAAGRWPANVALDEDQAAALDQMSGTLTSGKMQPTQPKGGNRSVYGQDAASGCTTMETYGDKGGASRFFYVAKAPAKERPKVDGIAHPTVKPVALMRWLIRLVTPPGGTVLDPFAGSGTTIEAAMLEGFAVVGIEREADYLPLIQARIDRNTYEQPDERYGIDSFTLFDTEGETA